MDQQFNIFISHDSRDQLIAVEVKKFLENIFFNADVYVSTRDLEGGQTWIEKIKGILKKSQIIITLLTKKSLENKWLYFESGVGFVEDRTIPLLSYDVNFDDLTAPLNLLQARTLSLIGIKQLVGDIFKKLNFPREPQKLHDIESFLSETQKIFQWEKIQELQKELLLNDFNPNIKQWVYQNRCLVHDYLLGEFSISVDVYALDTGFEIQIFGRDKPSTDYLFDVMELLDNFLPKSVEKYERKNDRLIFKKFKLNSDVSEIAKNLIDVLKRINLFKTNQKL